jgi:hypothetical protein
LLFYAKPASSIAYLIYDEYLHLSISTKYTNDYITVFNVEPILAGEGVTVTPAFSKALILSLAPPLPPEIIAPA